MKRVRLLPSLIMLVLCVGILAVGVYALTPISNSIAGTISISAGKASIAITGYVDGTEVYPRTELHGGMEWEISSSSLNFDASNYFFAEQVPSKVIKLKIENLSSVPYGVFFCDYADVNATSSNIKTTGVVKSTSDSSTTIANASMDYYKYVSAEDSSSTLDQVEMTITLSVASLSASAQTGTFTYYLNVEEYNSSLNTTEEFIKVDDSLTAIAESAYAGNETIKNVIIPNSITTIGASAFSGCTGLTEITIPASVTTIGAGAFDGCSNLQKIIVAAHSTSGNFDASLPTISGFSWYLNGEHQTSLTYSTEMYVYTLGEQVILSTKKITATIEYADMSVVTSGARVEGAQEWEVGATVTLYLYVDGYTEISDASMVAIRNSTASQGDWIEYWYGCSLPVSYSFELKEDSVTDYIFLVEITQY